MATGAAGDYGPNYIESIAGHASESGSLIRAERHDRARTFYSRAQQTNQRESEPIPTAHLTAATASPSYRCRPQPTRQTNHTTKHNYQFTNNRPKWLTKHTHTHRRLMYLKCPTRHRNRHQTAKRNRYNIHPKGPSPYQPKLPQQTFHQSSRHTHTREHSRQVQSYLLQTRKVPH